MSGRHVAAIKIQSYYRMTSAKAKFQLLKKKKAEILKAQAIERALKRDKSSVILQHAFKGWMVRLDFIRQKKAATLLKATWRGYKARMALKKAVIAKQLAEVQRRVSEAHKNATEDKKLCNKTTYALDYLFNYKDMAMLITALKDLDVSLRYSTNCCSRMLEEDDGKAIGNLVIPFLKQGKTVFLLLNCSVVVLKIRQMV
jgi:hypothetical protein